MLNKQRIIITPGEPAGIGPDLIALIAQEAWPVELVICADPLMLIERAKQLKLSLLLHKYQPYKSATPHPIGELSVLALNAPNKVIPGKLNVSNSHYVISTLIRACDGCMNGEFAALLTGPVHKGIINDAGLFFSGHTEFLAANSNSKQVVMMLISDSLRVALLTTHLPLMMVPSVINNQLITDVIHILVQELRSKFAIPHPKIYVCGLNPHAGEGGHLGREEIDIIIPTLNTLRTKNYHLVGPLSADTIFHSQYLQQADVILAMYHDQGLPVLKYQGFGNIVNITLGLPFLRTSVDHGTALELAGSGLAKSDSIKAALHFTINMISKQQQHNE